MIINGNLYLEKSSIQSLGNIKEIKGQLDLFNCKNIESLENVEYIAGNLYLSGSTVKSLGKLKFVGGDFVINHFLQSLGKLKEVKGYLKANNCKKLLSLGKLEKVKYLDISECINLKDLGNLKEVKKIIMWDCGITKETMEEKYPEILRKTNCDFGGGN